MELDYLKTKFSSEDLKGFSDLIATQIGPNGFDGINFIMAKYCVLVCKVRIYFLHTTQDVKYFSKVPNSELVGMDVTKMLSTFEEAQPDEHGLYNNLDGEFIFMGEAKTIKDLYLDEIEGVLHSLTSRFNSPDKLPESMADRHALTLINSIIEVNRYFQHREMAIQIKNMFK